MDETETDMTLTHLMMASAAVIATPETDIATVAQIDQLYQLAVKKNDADTMARIMHPKFELVLGDGRRFSREDLLEAARTSRFIYELQDEEAGSQHVIVWGDTAIVTAKLLLKARRGDEVIDRVLWFSDTYVRTDRGWMYLFGQASLPLPSDPSHVDKAAV